MNWGLGWGENGHKIITNKGNAFQGALLCKRSFVFVEHYKEDVAAESMKRSKAWQRSSCYLTYK